MNHHHKARLPFAMHQMGNSFGKPTTSNLGTLFSHLPTLGSNSTCATYLKKHMTQLTVFYSQADILL